MSLLSVKNLSIKFNNDQTTVEVVRNISFDVAKGKTLALVGASGSGKTLTAQSILRLLPASPNCAVYGEIWFDGINLQQLTNHEMRAVRGKRISMIFQEPMTALNPLHTIQRQIAETIIIHASLSKQQVQYRIDELLTLVGLEQLKNRGTVFPHEISGGQRQRVMIAMSLANRPQLLIADEPTTAVDVITQASLLKLLLNLQEQFKISIMLISHDLNIVQKIAHDVCIMNQGEIIEHGPVDTLWRHPKHPYTQRLIEEDKPHNLFISSPLLTETLICGKAITVQSQKKIGIFNSDKQSATILHDINFSLSVGQTLGVVGESGSGKTTLACAILKLIPFQGELYFDNQALYTLSAKAFRPFRRAIQMVFQDPYGSLNPRFTIYEILKEGLTVHERALSPAHQRDRINQAMLDVNLKVDDLTKYPHQFSGGQRQRIALARVLILKPQLIILDEPTSALDRIIQRDIQNLLLAVQKKYQLSYILISHDLSVIRTMAHHIIVMKNGRVIECDTMNNIMTCPRHPYTQELINASMTRV